MSGDSRTLKVIVVGNSKGAQAALRTLGAETKKQETANHRLSNSMDKLRGKFAVVAKSAAVTATAVAAATAGAVYKVGADYEKSLNTLDGLREKTDLTTSQIAKSLQGSSREFAKYGFSVGDAAAGVVELVRAGKSVEEAMQAVKATTVLARAGTISVGDAATYVSDQLNVFRLRATEAARVSNVLANAANISSSDVSQIGLALQQVSSVAYRSGLSLEETAAAIVTMSNAGIKGSDAGTSLKTMLIKLQNPTDEARAALKKLGVSLYDAHGATRPFRDLIADMAPALNRMTDESRDYAVGTIFGTDAVRAANEVLRTGVKSFDSYTKGVSNAGAAERLAAKNTQGFSGFLMKTRASLESVAQGIYLRLAPSLTKFGEYLTVRIPEWVAKAREVLNGPFGQRIKEDLALIGKLALQAGRVFVTTVVPAVVAFGAIAEPIFRTAARIVIPLLKFVADHNKVFVPLLVAFAAYKASLVVNTAFTRVATRAIALQSRAVQKLSIDFSNMSLASDAAQGQVVAGARAGTGALAAEGRAAVSLRYKLAAVAAQAAAAYGALKVYQTFRDGKASLDSAVGAARGQLPGKTIQEQIKFLEQAISAQKNQSNLSAGAEFILGRATGIFGSKDPRKLLQDMQNRLQLLYNQANGPTDHEGTSALARQMTTSPVSQGSKKSTTENFGFGGGADFDLGGGGGGGSSKKSAAQVAAEKARREAERAKALLQAVGERLASFASKALLDGITRNKATLTKATNALVKSIGATKASDKAKSVAYTVLLKDTKALGALIPKRDAIAKKLVAAEKKLASLKEARSSLASTLAEKMREYGQLANTWLTDENADNSPGKILERFQKRLADTQKFTADLATLVRRGLSADLVRQISEMGVEAGSGMAAALAQATPQQIAELNKTGAALASEATKNGNLIAGQLYDAGINAAKGLVEGLKSQQKAIEDQMIAIAKSMTTAIRAALGIKSPSREFMKIGQYTAQGMALGIEAGTDGVQKAVDALAEVRVRGGGNGSPSKLMGAVASANRGLAVNVTINGSVTSERDLVRTITEGIRTNQVRAGQKPTV